MHPPRVDDVIDYLRVHGWTVTGGWRNAQVWSLREFDVLVPPSDALPDTAIRLRDLARCVADAEGRSARAVWRELSTPGADLISYRTTDPSIPVTLPMGARAVDAVRDLVVLCAGEVVGRTGSARHRDTVRELLERSSMSWSEEVFGLDVALPLEEDQPASLGRMTALRVLRYATAVYEVVESADAGGPERLGLSDSGCEAVADLAGPDRGAPFELGFHWSRWVPRAPEKIVFPQGSRAFDRPAGTARDDDPAVVSGSVEGLVTSLTDDADGDRLRIKVRGVLEVDGSPTGRQRTVVVRLTSAADYATALAAHRDGRAVRAHGTVTGSGRARVLTTTDNGLTVAGNPPNTP